MKRWNVTRRGILLVGLLAATALMAGCLGFGDESGTDSASETEDTEPASQQQAAQNETQQQSGEATGPVVETEAIEYEGALGPGVSVMGRGLSTSGEARWMTFDLEGTVTSVQLEMTWNSTNPTTETLLLAAGPREDTDGGGWQATDQYESVVGSPPLNLTIEDPGWTKGKYVLWAWWDNEQPAAANAMEQGFTVNGAVEYEPQTDS